MNPADEVARGDAARAYSFWTPVVSIAIVLAATALVVLVVVIIWRKGWQADRGAATGRELGREMAREVRHALRPILIEIKAHGVLLEALMRNMAASLGVRDGHLTYRPPAPSIHEVDASRPPPYRERLPTLPDED